MQQKIRLAIVKVGGYVPGGTEKFLQMIAIHIDKNLFDVTFFSGKPPGLYNGLNEDPMAEVRLRDAGVHVVRFRVGSIQSKRPYRWDDTDFWEHFHESDFDILQTGRAGYSEYPFNKIRNLRIVDSIHLDAGVDNQSNIVRVMHLSPWSQHRWISSGGDPSRAVLVSHPIPPTDVTSVFEGFQNKFVFGMHQRPDDRIYSHIPLEAYAAVENETTAFLLLGGSRKYGDQASRLKLSNFTQLPFSADPSDIARFLNSLNVYAHGRLDGEINSTAIAEALRAGLPVVSHSSPQNNGHRDCIGKGGVVVDSTSAYTQEMRVLLSNQEYRTWRAKQAEHQFTELYELLGQIQRVQRIYFEAVQLPFADMPMTSIGLSHMRQFANRAKRKMQLRWS